ncbi:MAG: hypothetical protein EOP60_04950 [Sphingomonadales bacterium]|nr:MAG: hypothetical protein EOP60_04950 [Sphingomonadales bacterium]
MAHADPVVSKILTFLERIGIPVIAEPVQDSLLPGTTVRRGALVFDPESIPFPGDLLHEAGHIAVTDPKVRATQEEVADDPGEEMAAMAWSYAAALEAGVDPTIVFHDHGYRGGGNAYLASYTDGNGATGIGVPLLRWFGMTSDFPIMTRWLR